jgi:hypothetical protein
LLLACGIATAWFGNRLTQTATTTRDGSQLNRYAQEPIPDVVLVGSSVTFRLSEPYFSTPRLRNLAIAGGSPMTGLAIVVARSQLPKLILVEANVLSRAADASLVSRYSGVDAGGPLFFRPARALVAAYENWRHAPLRYAEASAALDRLVKAPPSDFDNRPYLQLAIAQANAEDAGPVTLANVEEIKRLAASIEARGSRLLLFELPYPSELEAARFARETPTNRPRRLSGAGPLAVDRGSAARAALAGRCAPRRAVRRAGRARDRQGDRFARPISRDAKPPT